MNWDDLRFLSALNRSGSLSAAAKLLKVDQTTVSRRLDALQKNLGSRLIERTGKGIRLTATGRKACAAAEAMEADAQTLVREVSGADERIEGVVRVATPIGFVPVLCEAFADLRQLHPGLRFEISSGAVPVNLVEGAADFAVRAMGDSQPSLLVRRLGEIRWHLYASEPYLDRKGTARSLSGHDVIGYTDALTRTPGGIWIEQHSSGANFVMRVDNVFSALDAAAAGMGIAASPEHIAARYTALREARAGSVGASDMFVVGRRDLIRMPRVRTTIDHLMKYVKTRTNLG